MNGELIGRMSNAIRGNQTDDGLGESVVRCGRLWPPAHRPPPASLTSLHFLHLLLLLEVSMK